MKKLSEELKKDGNYLSIQAEAYARMIEDCEVGPDGLHYCRKCGGVRESPREIGNGQMINLIIACPCEEKRRTKERRQAEAIRRANNIERLRKEGIRGADLLNARFENDDSPKSVASITMRRYVEVFDEMYKKGYGVILYGNIGTGKTFYAGCAANAVAEMEKSVLIISMPEIVMTLQDSRQKRELIEKITRPALLVIDDLGAERNTTFGLEQVFAVINRRVLSKKPLIVTTNLSMAELKNPDNDDLRRIYDRVLGVCPVRIALTGPSRRTGGQNASTYDILWGNQKDALKDK